MECCVRDNHPRFDNRQQSSGKIQKRLSQERSCAECSDVHLGKGSRVQRSSVDARGNGVWHRGADGMLYRRALQRRAYLQLGGRGCRGAAGAVAWNSNATGISVAERANEPHSTFAASHSCTHFGSRCCSWPRIRDGLRFQVRLGTSVYTDPQRAAPGNLGSTGSLVPQPGPGPSSPDEFWIAGYFRYRERERRFRVQDRKPCGLLARSRTAPGFPAAID